MLQLRLLAISIPASRVNKILFAAMFDPGVEPQDDGTLPVPGYHVTLACGAAQGMLPYHAVHASQISSTGACKCLLQL